MGYGGFYGGGGGLAAAAAKEDAEVQKAHIMAGAEEDKANILAGNVRGSGALTHYRPVGGWNSPGPGNGAGEGAPGGGAPALVAAARLGEPGSYDGGRGAPEPVGVIRGMKQTAATDTGGTQLEEFATPLQAKQAWNQSKGIGAFMPLGTTLAAQKGAAELERVKAGGPALAAAAAAPGLEAESGQKVGAANLDYYKRNLPGNLGLGHEYDESSKKWAPSTDPTFLALHQKYAPMAYDNPKGAVAGMMGDYQDLQNQRLIDKHGPTVLAPALQDPAVKRWAMTTPEGRATAAAFIKNTVKTQGTPGVASNLWYGSTAAPANPFDVGP